MTCCVLSARDSDGAVVVFENNLFKTISTVISGANDCLF